MNLLLDTHIFPGHLSKEAGLSLAIDALPLDEAVVDHERFSRPLGLSDIARDA